MTQTHQLEQWLAQEREITARLEAGVGAGNPGIVHGDLGRRLATHRRAVGNVVGAGLDRPPHVDHDHAQSGLAIVRTTGLGSVLGDGTFGHAGILYQGCHS